MALPAKQRIFVREYLIDKNATRAAKAAGYSKKTAQEQGSRLLSNAMVKRAIAAAVGPVLQKLDITAERVIAKLGEIAFTELSKPNKKLIRPKYSDQTKALEILAKHFKLLTDVTQHTGPNGGPVVILTLPRNGSEADEDAAPSEAITTGTSAK